MYSIVVYGTYKPWNNIMQLAQQVVTGWMVQELNPGGSEFLHLSKLTLGPTQPPVQWIMCLFPGCSVCRVWHSPPTPIKH